MPQEDGIIHRDGQLQDCGQGLGNVGDLTEEDIGAQIQKYHHADAGKEDQRRKPAVQQQRHGCRGQHHGQRNINRLFLLAEVFQVQHQGGHSGNEALFAANSPDFRYGVHGDVGRGGAVEEDGHQGGVSGIESLVDLLRQQLHGN